MNFSEGRQGGCGRTPRTPLNPPLAISYGPLSQAGVLSKQLDEFWHGSFLLLQPIIRCVVRKFRYLQE